MKAHRTAAKWFVGLLMAGVLVAGGSAPAHAGDFGGDVRSGHPAASKPSLRDTGWD